MLFRKGSKQNCGLLLSESIHGRLKVSSMNGPQQDVNGIVQLLPNDRLGHVHSLLHRSTRFEIGGFIVGHLTNHKNQRSISTPRLAMGLILFFSDESVFYSTVLSTKPKQV